MRVGLRTGIEYSDDGIRAGGRRRRRSSWAPAGGPPTRLESVDGLRPRGGGAVNEDTGDFDGFSFLDFPNFTFPSEK